MKRILAVGKIVKGKMYQVIDLSVYKQNHKKRQGKEQKVKGQRGKSLLPNT